MTLAINPNCCFPNPKSCYSWPVDCPTDSAHPWTEADLGDTCKDRYSTITMAGVTAGSGTTTINGDSIPTALNKLFLLEKISNVSTSLRWTDTWNVVHNSV